MYEENRARLILTYQMLLNSDKDHPVTYGDIQEMLSKNNIRWARKTLYSDLNAIEAYDIRITHSRPSRYQKILFWMEEHESYCRSIKCKNCSYSHDLDGTLYCSNWGADTEPDGFCSDATDVPERLI